jgi:4-amino-4-deoxy-L-arabinose transferase-like glycosyltransferase
MKTGNRLDFLRRLDSWRLCLIIIAVIYGSVLSVDLTSKAMVWDEVTHLTGGLLLSRGQFATWVWTNSLYPPVYDIFTAIYYLASGPSVFAARMVSVTFSVLSLFVIYEIAELLYNKKTALLSALLFSVMPGIIWLSRIAMIETMLIFVFCVSMLFFFRWIQTNCEKDRILSIAVLVIGIAVKYQMLVIVPIIMLLGMFFWKKEYLKLQVKIWLKMPRLVIVAAAVLVILIIFLVFLKSGLLNVLFFAIQTGTAQKAVYSALYPMPIYYLIVMNWYSNLMHPISLLLYIIGLMGLGLMVYRRNRPDKFLLLWFIVVYIVFSVISNRDWRYPTIAFPVLAIASASILTTAFDKLAYISKTSKSFVRKWGITILSMSLVTLALTGIFLSCADSYTWVSEDRLDVPIEQATSFALQGLRDNQTLVVACPLNFFNEGMVSFYLSAKNPNQKYNQVWQYPALAVDAYTLDFNVTQFTSLCQQQNVKYILLYEFKGLRYFNSSFTAQIVFDSLFESDRFSEKASFGNSPNRIFILSFT